MGVDIREIGSNPYPYGVKTFHQQLTTRTNTTFHDIAHAAIFIPLVLISGAGVADGVKKRAVHNTRRGYKLFSS